MCYRRKEARPHPPTLGLDFFNPCNVCADRHNLCTILNELGFDLNVLSGVLGFEYSL